jgi:hypothetical protein
MSLIWKCFGRDASDSSEGKKKKNKREERNCCDSTVSDGSSTSTPTKRNSRKDKSAKSGPVLPAKSYMPVSKDNPNYNMNHVKRGKALIFNFDRWVG